MIGGNEANLKLVSYEPEAVKALAKLAHDLGVLIHIEGVPFGDGSKASCAADRDVPGGEYKKYTGYDRIGIVSD